ncbi:MAG: hypothetical protein KKC75_07215 [Nanoarchaeota archaeon]|nr:hypothetical protein [Nanoarchaeota archaeon]MBU1005478.1 hypothetical protein [Nanoarchaeota archaeon]MBU1947048.1 hypothetical protein [Nanoarchaeota archaeon]
MRPEIIKGIGIFFTVLIVLDLILFAMRKVSNYVFWAVIIICAAMAYWVLPRLRNK